MKEISRTDRRLLKRIWWTLFTRDCSVAVALDRPIGINMKDSDVESLSEDDFEEGDIGREDISTPNPVHVRFFLQYVALCKIMARVLSRDFSMSSKLKSKDLTKSSLALATWLQNCPSEVNWHHLDHNFWAAILHLNY